MHFAEASVKRGVCKNTHIMNAAWPSYIDVSGKIFMIYHCLYKYRVPALTVIEVSVVKGRRLYWYERTIYCPYTLRKTTLGLKSFNHIPLSLPNRKLDVISF